MKSEYSKGSKHVLRSFCAKVEMEIRIGQVKLANVGNLQMECKFQFGMLNVNIYKGKVGFGASKKSGVIGEAEGLM